MLGSRKRGEKKAKTKQPVRNSMRLTKSTSGVFSPQGSCVWRVDSSIHFFPNILVGYSPISCSGHLPMGHG